MTKTKKMVVVLTARCCFNPTIIPMGVFNSRDEAMQHVQFLQKEYPEHYQDAMSGYSWHADEVYYYDA